MAGRTSDEQRKRIIADYLETESVNAAAKRNGVGWKTAKNAIDGNKEVARKLEQKKEQNTADILAHMDTKREKVCEVIDIALEVLPQKIADAKSAAEVTTALGTLIDKWTMANGKKDSENGMLADLIDGLKDENG